MDRLEKKTPTEKMGSRPKDDYQLHGAPAYAGALFCAELLIVLLSILFSAHTEREKISVIEISGEVFL